MTGRKPILITGYGGDLLRRIYLGSSYTNLISGMSACAGAGSTNCKETSNNSDGAQEGTWVGIAVGAWVALLVIVWFARTCSNRNRRRRALRTFGCLQKKKVNDAPPGYSTIRASNQTDRGSVYYTPSLPPTYEEILMRPSRYMVQSAAYGLYHQCGPGGHQVRLTLPCSGCLPNRYRNRSSRSSLSMLSISLATIEEEDRGDASQPPSPRPRCDGDAKQTQIPDGAHRCDARSAGLTFKIDYDNPADVVQQKSKALDYVDNVTKEISNHEISDSDAHNESTFVDCYSEERTRPGDRSRQQHAPMLIIT